jgi:aspartyl-tRNA(Asn)/glutamyl-tRNA(Gln) amidotransferase subunit A
MSCSSRVRSSLLRSPVVAINRSVARSRTGIVGLKPTYGRVSMRGVMTLSWTLDHVGPMCKTVEDAALMMNVIAGYDLRDPTTEDVPVPDYLAALRMSTSRLRLGIPRTPFYDNLDPEIAKAVETATGVVRRMTASIQDVQLPQGANSAEIWGPEAYLWHSEWITQSPQKYQPSVRTSLERSADDLAWQYVRTRRQVELLRREVTSVFLNVDLLVLPTMKVPPGLLQGGGGGGGGGGNNNSIFDVFGLPAISVPCGFTTSGLPIGLQIVGAHFAEPTVFALAAAYERATDWHTRNPRLQEGI